MSAANFQTVMAHLIRFPSDPFEIVEEKLSFPELSERERERLIKMAADPLVRKYGRKMSYCRRRDATQILRLSRGVISEESLDRMFYEGFERTRVSTDFVMLGVQFIDYLLSSPEWQGELDAYPPFTRDLLKYDRAKANIVRQVIYYEDDRLPPNSLLRHQAFDIIDLDYDVPTLDALRVKNPEHKGEPIRKPVKLIFMRSEQPPFYRMFQIDSLISGFLLTQKTAPENWKEPLPQAYAGMVGVGLCKTLPSATTVVN